MRLIPPILTKSPTTGRRWNCGLMYREFQRQP
jgi:hypothetical protein